MTNNSTEISEGITLYSNFNCKVVRYSDKVIKSHLDLHPSEAASMRFIAANTSIPIPRVYAEGTESAPSIAMDYIEGGGLDKVWNELPEAKKLDLSDQLKEMLSELRDLKGQLIGSLGCGRAIDGRKFDIEGGPLDTEAEFNCFLLSDRVKSTTKILRDITSRSL